MNELVCDPAVSPNVSVCDVYKTFYLKENAPFSCDGMHDPDHICKVAFHILKMVIDVFVNY